MTPATLSLLLAFTPPEPVGVDPVITEPSTDVAPLESPSPVPEPAAQPVQPAPQPAAEPAGPTGGFGSVTSVSTESNVVAPAPEPVTDLDDEDSGPRRELSLRAELGYGQLALGNPTRARGGALDHQGASLRAQFALYPWLSKGRRFGVGIGFTYAYQGFNRKDLPATVELERSRGQQQVIGFRLPLLFRLHREHLSLEPSGLLAVALYSASDDVLAGGRQAIIPKDATALALGGDLAICSVWDMVCVVGGATGLFGLETLDAGDPTSDPTWVDPWGWHIGLGVDVVRAISRGNRTAN